MTIVSSIFGSTAAIRGYGTDIVIFSHRPLHMGSCCNYIAIELVYLSIYYFISIIIWVTYRFCYILSEQLLVKFNLPYFVTNQGISLLVSLNVSRLNYIKQMCISTILIEMFTKYFQMLQLAPSWYIQSLAISPREIWNPS